MNKEIATKRADLNRSYYPWLVLLLGLFVLRVLAQMIQSVVTVSFLPAFDAWHSNAMPYPVLVAFQLMIVATLAIICRRVRNGKVVASETKHRLWFAFGSLYFTIMVVRLVAGQTFLAQMPWFSQSLPAIFHLVLAAFILFYAAYLRAILRTAAT